MDPKQKLDTLIEQYNSVVFAKKHLIQVERRLRKAEQHEGFLKRKVDKEYQDVVKMNKMNIRHIFNNILGNESEAYEKEKQEYLMAVLAFKEHNKMLELLKFEHQLMVNKIKDHDSLLFIINDIITKRDEKIIEQFPDLYHEYDQLQKKKEDISNLKSSYKFALETLAKVDHTLKDMIELLENAKYSGTWGNTFDELKLRDLKNFNINKAHELSYKVKQHLQELVDEHTDIAGISIEKLEEIEGFNKVYYHKLISDWVVHTKIINAIKYLTSFKKKINDINDQLGKKQEAKKEELIELDKKINYYIIKAIR